MLLTASKVNILLSYDKICMNHLSFNSFHKKVYVRHPELDLAKVNRDYVLKQVCQAVNTISDVTQGKSSQQNDMYNGAGELAAALDDFDVWHLFILYI